jgi:uncharacterized protein YbaP (TraB family)
MFEQGWERLLESWKSGDADGMEQMLMRIMKEDRRLLPIYEIIYYERNRNMSSRIEGLLGTKDTYFVTVGAAHMIGEEGIVEILRKKGYPVEQL